MGLVCGGDDIGTVGILKGELSTGTNWLGPNATRFSTLVTPAGGPCNAGCPRFSTRSAAGTPTAALAAPGASTGGGDGDNRTYGWRGADASAGVSTACDPGMWQCSCGGSSATPWEGGALAAAAWA